MRHVGEDGYTELARQVAGASDRLLAGLEAVEGVRVLGRPSCGLVAFTMDGPEGPGGGGDLSLLLHLADEMRLRGWYLQPQLSFDGMPPNLHLTLTPATVGQVDALLADLDEALAAARALPPVTVDPGLAELAAAYEGKAAQLGPDEVEAVLAYAGLGGADGTGGALPERTAPVLVLLDALPAPLKERLLAEFVGTIFRI